MPDIYKYLLRIRKLKDKFMSIPKGLRILKYPILSSCFPSAAAVAEQIVSVEMFWRSAILLAAIRLYELRNNRVPEKLGDVADLVPKECLIDPWTGKEFVYKKQKNDFWLYSLGENGVDDNPSLTGQGPIYETGAYWYDDPDMIIHQPAGTPRPTKPPKLKSRKRKKLSKKKSRMKSSGKK